MNHVAKVRKVFENREFESLDINLSSSSIAIRNNHNKDPFNCNRFKRSQTLIDFSKFKNGSKNDDDDEENENVRNGEIDQVKRHHRQVEEKNQKSVERKNLNDSRRFERQNSDNSDSSYRSVRRSPAFRRADNEKKKPVTPPKNIKLTRQSPIIPIRKQVDELEYLATSETIKKALKSPLPTGPAPKKPPRIFASSPGVTNKEIIIEKKKAEDLQVQSELVFKKFDTPTNKSKEIPKKSFGSLLQCIITPCSIDPIYKEQIKRERIQRQEEIYMEPFAHLDKDFNLNDNNCSTLLTESPSSSSSSQLPQQSTKTEELHYMCTNILDQTNNNCSFIEGSSLDNNQNSFSPFDVDMNESFDKINALMDVMYDEKQRDCMMDEHSGSSTEMTAINNKNPTNRISRSLTEKRKNYVRRVTQSITAKDINGSLHKIPSAASIISQFQKIIDSNLSASQSSINRKNEGNLFKMVLLIGYDIMNKKGYIKSIFPKQEKPLPMIEQFVYPTSKNPCDLMSKENQNFTLILTDEYGSHSFGYCRQIIPEGFENCLPLTYCIISSTSATGFYFNLLYEIEARHGLPEAQFVSMLRQLQRQEIPTNGKNLYLKLFDSPSRKPPDVPQQKPKVHKRLSLESPEWLKASSTPLDLSPLNRSLTECVKKPDEIKILRSNDVRLESNELSVLYEQTTSDLLVLIFGTLLIERKVILLSENVSKISSCIMALYSLLYPFQWHHTIISIVPDKLVELLSAPFPFFAGVLKNSITDSSLLDIEDGIVVDLDGKQLIKKCGDESTLIPETLKKSLLLSLKIVEAVEKGKLVNVLIAEAFLQFFIKLFATLNASTFDRSKFIEAHNDQATKYFLEYFVETVMFKDFLVRKKENEKEREADVIVGNYFDLFNAKVLEKSATLSNQQQRKHVQMLLKSSKQHKHKRNFKDKIKDFLNN